MEFPVDDAKAAAEFANRGIGFEREGKYYVDVLQAAYLTEIGKCNYPEAVEKANSDGFLRKRYLVFRDLRGKMHVANYIAKDDVFLVYEKGMVPKHAESKYMLKLLENTSLDGLIAFRRQALSLRKDFIIACVAGESVEYYKFGEIQM